MPADDEHDVIIVGGGAAGLSCALECVDIQLDTVVLEVDGRPGGQMGAIPHALRNVLGWRFDAGAALLDGLAQSTALLGPRLRLAQSVTQLDLGARWVEVDGRRLHAQTLVLATGTRSQQLPAVTEGAFGGDVTYQAEARWDHFVGHSVVVVGGGDSATLDALALAKAGSTVTLVHRSLALSARDDIIEQLRAQSGIEELGGWEVESLAGADRLAEVVLRRGDGEHRRVAAERLVAKIARVPRTELFRDQLAVDHAGAVVVDAELRTSRQGVFAAGDVVAGAYARVAAAMGHGSLAARSVLRHVQGRG